MNVVLELADIVTTKLGIILLPFSFTPKTSFHGGQQAECMRYGKAMAPLGKCDIIIVSLQPDSEKSTHYNMARALWSITVQTPNSFKYPE